MPTLERVLADDTTRTDLLAAAQQDVLSLTAADDALASAEYRRRAVLAELEEALPS
jgi:hypothetical protein